MAGIHQHSVVLFFHEGEGTLELGGRHALTAGSLVQIPSWMVHRVHLDQKSRYSTVVFDPSQLPGKWTRTLEQQRQTPKVLLRPHWGRSFEALLDRPDELLWRLTSELPEPATPEVVSKAVALAHEALDKSWGAGEIAEMLGYSLPHLTTQVRRHTGRSLGRWVLDARLDLAAVLLRDELTVAQVAERCGFADLSHFRRAFKKYKGQVPSRMR